MNKLIILIKKYSVADARSAFYYLSRYLKQASTYDEYQKDIFIDDIESAPNELVKNLTLKLINYIEKSQGKKSANFTDDEYIQWMDKINIVESELDPLPSKSQINIVEKIIDDLIQPTIILKTPNKF
ncbi:MAG: hypothetical protein HRT40_01685 [Campylobacteraceae bacterium]|nr:hypothetical protein [Campylobacteraceae bacterium]